MSEIFLPDYKITEHYSFSPILLLLLNPPFFLGQRHRCPYLLFVNVFRSRIFWNTAHLILTAIKLYPSVPIGRLRSTITIVLRPKTWIVVVIKRCSVRHWPPVVCRKVHVLFTLFVLFAHSGVQHILSCVFVLFVFVLCTPCCQCLWIVPFWLAHRYSLTFIYRSHRFNMGIGFVLTVLHHRTVLFWPQSCSVKTIHRSNK